MLFMKCLEVHVFMHCYVPVVHRLYELERTLLQHGASVGDVVQWTHMKAQMASTCARMYTQTGTMVVQLLLQF